MPYTIPTPIAGTPISASVWGAAVKSAIDAIDLRVSALEGFTTGKPFCKVAAIVIQGFGDNVDTAVTFTGADLIDTHGFHDPVTNNSRFTPTVPGLYHLSGVLAFAGSTVFNHRRLWWRKNGTTAIPPATAKGNMVNNITSTLETEAYEIANGTTDYFELVCNEDNTASATINTVVTTQTVTTAVVEYLRGLP